MLWGPWQLVGEWAGWRESDDEEEMRKEVFSLQGLYADKTS